MVAEPHVGFERRRPRHLASVDEHARARRIGHDAHLAARASSDLLARLGLQASPPPRGEDLSAADVSSNNAAARKCIRAPGAWLARLMQMPAWMWSSRNSVSSPVVAMTSMASLIDPRGFTHAVVPQRLAFLLRARTSAKPHRLRALSDRRLLGRHDAGRGQGLRLHDRTVVHGRFPHSPAISPARGPTRSIMTGGPDASAATRPKRSPPKRVFARARRAAVRRGPRARSEPAKAPERQDFFTFGPTRPNVTPMEAHPSDEPRPPFGRYLLRERIAQGGMGEVFVAVAVGADGFEKPVVVKRLLPKFASRPDIASLLSAKRS